MSSHAPANVLTFLADGVISKGMVVKAGSDRKHVAKATAATQKAVGLSMSTTTAAEEAMEVAMPGGGGKALLGGTVSFGDFLASDAAGKLVATTTANDKVIAQAMEDGVANDLISVTVVSFNY